MDQAILLIVILLFLALPTWQIIKQNKQIRNIREMQNRLSPGAEVITGSGLHGVVVDSTDTTVDLIIADGVVTRWEKTAVARNLSDGTGADYASSNQPPSGAADNTDNTASADDTSNTDGADNKNSADNDSSFGTAER